MIAENIWRYEFGHSYAIYIVFPQDKNYGTGLLETARASMGEGKQYFDTYTLQEDLWVFYIMILDGLFYLSGDSAIIFLDYLDIRRFHALQMMIPRLPAEAIHRQPAIRRRNQAAQKPRRQGARGI